MQRFTVTAKTSTDAMQIIKQKYGDDVSVESVTQHPDGVKIIALLDSKDAIIVPSMQERNHKDSKNLFLNLKNQEKSFLLPDEGGDSPLNAVITVQKLCKAHHLSVEFENQWLKSLEPHLLLPNISVLSAFTEAFSLDSTGFSNLPKDKIFAFIGESGVGKTSNVLRFIEQAQGVNSVKILYDFNTVYEGNNFLIKFCKRFGVDYLYGPKAWDFFQSQAENRPRGAYVVDTNGFGLRTFTKDLNWLVKHLETETIVPVLNVSAEISADKIAYYQGVLRKYKNVYLVLSMTDQAFNLQALSLLSSPNIKLLGLSEANHNKKLVTQPAAILKKLFTVANRLY